MRDIVIAMGASTNSRFSHQYNLPGTFAPLCSYKMLRACVEAADEMGATYHVGNILSSDVFYGDTQDVPDKFMMQSSWIKMGILAEEMEAAALYMNAARCHKNALAICTVSNHLVTGESTSAKERQESFTEMMEIALKTAKKLSK